MKRACNWRDQAFARRTRYEVTRMLADPKSHQFISQFASQWLALDKFQVLEPDRQRFPKLTRDARTQLAEEPIRFVEHLIKHNMSVRNLVSRTLCWPMRLRQTTTG